MRGSTLIESSWKTVDLVLLLVLPFGPDCRRSFDQNAKRALRANTQSPGSFRRSPGVRACAIDVSIDGPVPGCREAARVGVGLHLFPRLRGGWSHMTAYRT